MKFWFAKYNISNTLNQGSGQPPGAPTGAEGDASELKRFEHSLLELDQRLKAATPPLTAPDNLHSDVMRAVRKAARETSPLAPARFGWNWLPVPALAIALVLGWWFFPTP